MAFVFGFKLYRKHSKPVMFLITTLKTEKKYEISTFLGIYVYEQTKVSIKGAG